MEQRLTRRVAGVLHSRLPEAGFEHVPDPRREVSVKWPPFSESGTLSVGLGSFVGLTDGGAIESAGTVSVGGLLFSSCEITTRSAPLINDFLVEASQTDMDAWRMIQVQGIFDNILIEGTIIDDDSNDTFTCEGTVGFDTVFLLQNISDEMSLYLEENCIGGYEFY